MENDDSLGALVGFLVLFLVTLVGLVACIWWGIATSIDDGNFNKACIQAGGIYAQQDNLGRICIRVEDLIEVKEDN